jgi:recombinational DNA repair protein RecT
MLQLARRSGQVVGAEAHVVHSSDYFQCEYGSRPSVEHRPIITGEPGPILGAYAVIRVRDDTYPMVEYMTKQEIDRIRARSKAGSSGPWHTDYESMARKSVLRRVLNYAPAARELQQAIAVEDRIEQSDGNPDLSDILPVPDLDDDVRDAPMSKAAEIASKLDKTVTHTTGEVPNGQEKGE